MRFVSDSQRRAVFARMNSGIVNKFSDYPVKRKSKKEVEDILFDAVDVDSAARALKRRKGNFSEESRKKEFQVYDMWDAGLSIPEVAKATGISEGAVRAVIIGYGVDPAFVGYTFPDAINYYKEIEGLDISDDDAKSMLDKFNKGEDYHDLMESIRSKRMKKGVYWRGADEKSEDYVSKGNWDHSKYSGRPVFSKKKRERGYSETIDGYECDHCGCEFSNKTSAEIHSSLCNERDAEPIDMDDPSVPFDDFFSNDDGSI